MLGHPRISGDTITTNNQSSDFSKTQTRTASNNFDQNPPTNDGAIANRTTLFRETRPETGEYFQHSVKLNRVMPS
jgi:hypothetical protein